MAKDSLCASVVDRFWSHVEKGDGCWNWIGAGRGKTGYGCLKVDGKVVDAHRFSWVSHFGPIPHGLCVCHHCDNRLCVHPEHLFLGTMADNVRDMDAKGRRHMPFGEAVHTHKLTAAQVQGIRARRRTGVSQRELALLYDVSRWTIRGILSGRTWAHVREAVA